MGGLTRGDNSEGVMEGCGGDGGRGEGGGGLDFRN